MEVWRNIPGFGGDYQVSNFGRVRSTDRTRQVAPNRKMPRGFKVQIKGKLIRPTHLTNKNGKVFRLVLQLRRDGKYVHCGVHDAVLSAFIGPRPDGHYGCHKDDRPVNNRLANLYWGTPMQNSADKIRLENQPRGEDIPWSKVTESDVRYIRANAGRISQTAMAKRFGVNQSQISRIINRREWSHV